MRSLSKCILLLLVLSSCYGYYDLELPKTDPIFVVNGGLGNLENSSQISFGWSTTKLLYNCTNCPPYCEQCPPEDPNANVPNTIKAVLTGNDGTHLEFETQMPWKKGQRDWLIPNFVAQVGATYKLDVSVIVGNDINHYVAETTMLPTPVITATKYEIREGEIGKEDGFVPLISFLEPQNQRNYYLFKIGGASKDTYGPEFWKGPVISQLYNVSVLPDTFLPTNVINLSIDDGSDIRKYTRFYPEVSGQGSGAMVLMFSIDEQAYKFYKALFDQYDYDGGAYFPTPSTPQGNFSNGAIGIFMATEVQGAAIFIE